MKANFDEILEEDDIVTIGLVIDHPNMPPTVRVSIHGKEDKIIEMLTP